MNCLKRSDGTQVPRANVETTPNVRTNHRIRVFGENQFFVFFGGPKTFFGPPKAFFGLRNPTFGGVMLLKLFDPRFGFGATGCKIAIFWHNQPWKSQKLQLWSKSCRSMTPPKVRFLRPNKVLGAQKNFLGPPKTQKIDFLKKPELCDLTEHWRWFPQWPWSSGCPQTPVFNSKSSNFALA